MIHFSINLLAILRFIGVHWFIPLGINMFIVYIAHVSKAGQYVLQGTYDELLWFILLPMSWLGTVLLTLIFMSGAFEGIRWTYFGGKAKWDEKEKQRVININKANLRREIAEKRHAIMMKPYEDKFSKVSSKIAEHLLETTKKRKNVRKR